MQYQLSSCSAGAMRISSFGVAVMLVIVGCAALGNIYTQKVMQKRMAQPLMQQNLLLYGWGIFFNGLNWAQSSVEKPLVGNLSFWPVASIAFNAVYGLSISVIIKQFGSVTRTFINTAAICFTAMLDVAVLGERLSLLEATTVGPPRPPNARPLLCSLPLSNLRLGAACAHCPPPQRAHTARRRNLAHAPDRNPFHHC